jgi:glycosyltransferase 2 family protein
LRWKSNALKKFINIARYIIPVLLLGYIFSRIDFTTIISILEKSNKALILIAFLSFPARYLIFTLRWYVVINFFSKKRIGFLTLLKIIYEGLFLGYFIPSSVGVDIYRVVKLKNTGTTDVNISLILLERITGIIVCVAMLFILSNFIVFNNDDIKNYLNQITITLGVVLILALLFFKIFRKNARALKLMNSLEKIILKLILRFSEKVKREIPIKEGLIKQIFKFIVNPRLLWIAFVFSFANQIVGAVFSHILFIGLGADINLIDNLFAVPLLNIILLLPISFGGLGIREGSYILIFGLFNVNMETSLLASFVLLTSTLLNVGIGGFIYLGSKLKKSQIA